MKPTKFISKTLAALMTATALLGPAPLFAVTLPQDTTVAVGGTTLKIMAGSQYDVLTTSQTNLTVTVAAGEAFILRYPGTQPGGLENDGGYAACKVIYTRDNQMIINGPKTVTITPTTVNCSTVGYDTDTTPFLTISQPNGAETLVAGNSYQIFWQTAGRAPADVRLRLSTDGGATYQTVLTTNLINNGFYGWTVPTIVTTTQARLKLEGFEQGNVIAMDISNSNFTIQGTTPPPEEPQQPAQPATYDYDPNAETTAAATIDDDRGYVAPPPGTLKCVAGTRIKSASSTAVYYCGRDGKRHAFPNQKIHDSWFSGFAGVVTLSDEELAKAPLGENVTYRPGVRMIKLQTDPNVYAIGKDGTLRWIPDEWTAKAVYGDDWNTKIDDLSDSFFVDYTVGERIRSM